MKTPGVYALQDFIALYPPSAGTASPDNPLAHADVIFARFSDGSDDLLVYGKNRLNQIVESGIAERVTKIVVLLHDHELKILVGMVLALRGHHDLESWSEHRTPTAMPKPKASPLPQILNWKEVFEAALAKNLAAESKGRITYAVIFMDGEDNVLSEVRSRKLERALDALSDTPDGATNVSICTVHGNFCEDIERFDICDGRLLRRAP